MGGGVISDLKNYVANFSIKNGNFWGRGSEAVWKFSENSVNLVQVMLPYPNIISCIQVILIVISTAGALKLWSPRRSNHPLIAF